MKTMRSPRRTTRRYATLAAAALALVMATGLVAVARAQSGPGGAPAMMALDQDVTKLAIVVMANQTPITQADAQAVLPALEGIQAQLEDQRAAGGPPDEEAVAALDAQLRAALPANLLAAVDVVRLLTPSAPPGPAGPPPGLAPSSGDDRPAPPPGGPGHGPGGGGRGRGGMMGLSLLGPLVDFFRTTATG
jgi:hypothetical protein